LQDYKNELWTRDHNYCQDKIFFRKKKDGTVVIFHLLCLTQMDYRPLHGILLDKARGEVVKCKVERTIKYHDCKRI
jgi:hypothetical protein